MASIWSAAAATPAATDRIPADVSASGVPTRYTVQQLADLETLVGTSHNALGSINANTAINLALGPYVSATIAGALTFTFTNPPTSPNGCEWTLVLTNGGSSVVTWPGSITWAGATAPTLTASGVDVLHFASGNGGTNWYGWHEVDVPVGTTAGTVAAGDHTHTQFTTQSQATWEAGVGTAESVVSPAKVAAAIAALGGGGLTKFTEAESTSSPNATVYVDSLTAAGASTNVDFVCAPKGTGAFLLDIPDSASTGGNKRGANATDLQTLRSSASQVASGTAAFLFGGYGTASGNYSTAGGYGGVASGISSAAFCGYEPTASGSYALAMCGSRPVASGYSSSAIGEAADTRNIHGSHARSSGSRAASGDRQRLDVILSKTSTSATPVVLTSDGGAASVSNTVTLPNNATMFFEIDVVAHDTTLKSATWKIQGTIRRGANAASTAIIGTNVTTAFGSDLVGAPTTAPTVTANTTLGAIEVTFTGIAATTIYTTAYVRTQIAA